MKTAMSSRRLDIFVVAWLTPLAGVGIMPTLLSAQAFAADAGSGGAQGVTLPRLPGGLEGPGRFGAYYTRLRYTDEWERPWRVGDAADVLVRFDDGGHRFVFWRGTSYIPCWVTTNGIWYTNEFCETSKGGTEGCAEPISDKQTRYSHVRILESTPARAVVHWRYALTDVHYRIAHPDPNTGWPDWADEYYIIYPDAVAVRKIVLWTSRPDIWHEFQESIILNPPGTRPEDNLETAALSIANLDGQCADYVWDKPGEPRLTGKVPDLCIEVVNLKAPQRPFLMIAPDEASLGIFGGHAPGSRFNWWDHWPISQDKTWTRVATSPERPSHTSLSWIANPQKPVPRNWKAYERTEQSVTKLLLTGLTGKQAAELVPLARSWLRPPALKIRSSGFSGGDYDRSQRSYVLKRNGTNGSSTLEFVLEAGPGSPAVNPAFVIRGWGDRNASVTLDDLPGGTACRPRVGLVHAVDGTDLVVWLPAECTAPVRVRVSGP
jgi:hypothetical protein